MNYITLCFDDGLLRTAHKADKIVRACGPEARLAFFIVTGWLRGYVETINDSDNMGLLHGSIAEWREIYNMGHDVGSHSHTHFDIRVDDKPEDYQISLDVLKQIHPGPYYYAYPYLKNAWQNTLPGFDYVRRSAWIPRWAETPMSQIYDKLKFIYGAGDRLWFPIVFHGLDDEGWQPCSSEKFQQFVEYLLKNDIQIKTITEMRKLAKMYGVEM